MTHEEDDRPSPHTGQVTETLTETLTGALNRTGRRPRRPRH